MEWVSTHQTAVPQLGQKPESPGRRIPHWEQNNVPSGAGFDIGSNGAEYRGRLRRCSIPLAPDAVDLVRTGWRPTVPGRT